MTTFGHDPCGPPPRKPLSPDHGSRVPVDIRIDVGTMHEGVEVIVMLPDEAIRFDANYQSIGLQEVGDRLEEKGFTGYDHTDLRWDGAYFRTTVFKGSPAEPEDPELRYVYVVTDTSDEADNLWGVFSTHEKACAFKNARSCKDMLYVTGVGVDSGEIFWTHDAVGNDDELWTLQPGHSSSISRRTRLRSSSSYRQRTS